MMRLFLILVIFLAANFCNAQDTLNQVKRISKSEFRKLKAEAKRFVPIDLLKTKPLFVKPPLDELKKMRRNAHLQALLRNGYDTTSIDNNPTFKQYATEDQKYFADFNNKLYPYFIKELKKKGITAAEVNEGQEHNYSVNEFRFLIKLDFVSTMRHPEKSWFTKVTFYFIDRIGGKQYEKLLPTNYFVFDLIEKIN
jgi:hypothetical protein